VTQDGSIYFIGGVEGPVKIGWTVRDVRKRLTALQIGNPVRLSVLGEATGPRELEGRLHLRLFEHRVGGEWFERGPALDELGRLAAEGRARINRKRFPRPAPEPEPTAEEHEELLDEVAAAFETYEAEHGPIVAALEPHRRARV